FPEYQFKPQEFNLLVGKDGQLCDSREELVIHDFLLRTFSNIMIRREHIRFHNNAHSETYIPDWIIEQNDKKFIVEYFGLYHSNRYKGYKNKADRKIEYYSMLKDYNFIAIFPEDFKVIGFENLS